jgi:phosphatidylserine/phosphatidylglycerophosphate/cardiolipin synthase-like enzyme
MISSLQPAPIEHASYPARAGNRVEVLIDGAEALGRIFSRVAAARRSVWITVSFVQMDLPIPGTGRTLLALLTDLAARGVDVRTLFWWSEYPGIGSFRGTPEEMALLVERGVRVKMRWDQVRRGCHHQKSYVVDGEVAYVGGINLSAEALSTPDHSNDAFHDLFAEIHGPAVVDVAANFVQRWNQASETRTRGHAFPSLEAADDLPDSVVAPPPDCGPTPVQVVRTIRRGLYEGRFGWNGGGHDLSAGEASIQQAVHRWIAAAERSIYLENQFLMDVATIDLLAQAAGRGVEVLAVVPLEPDPNLLLYPKDEMEQTQAALSRLADTPSFGLFGLTAEGASEQPIYVHSKLMIVDDRVLMVGSANFWPPSFTRDSELNLCVWDEALAGRTRERLWQEHLQETTAVSLDDWRNLARKSSVRAVPIDPRLYYRFRGGTTAPWAGVEESG